MATANALNPLDAGANVKLVPAGMQLPLVLIVSYLIWPFFGARELHFLLSLALLPIVAVLSTQRLRGAIWMAIPTLLIVLISATVTIYYLAYRPFDAQATVKGLWYSLRPAVYLVLGYLVCASTANRLVLFRALVFAGAIASVYYIYQYVALTGDGDVSRTFIREHVGTGTIFWPLAIALSLFHSHWVIRSATVAQKMVDLPLVTAAFIACGSALILSTGRSGLILVALIGLARIRLVPLRNFTVCVTYALLFVALVCALTPLLPLLGIPLDLSWVEHVPLLKETVPVRQTTLADINTHWRGFETFLAFSHVYSRSPLAPLFGLGFAEAVPLGFDFVLGLEPIREIPVFHNGLSFLMVRAGLLGIILYAVQFIVIGRSFGRQFRESEDGGQAACFGAGLALFCAATTTLIGGFYDTHEGGSVSPFIIGYLLAMGTPPKLRPLRSLRVNGQPTATNLGWRSAQGATQEGKKVPENVAVRGKR